MTGLHELAVERHIAAPPWALWRAWTDHLTEWWCPRPWTTEIIANDMRPGGAAEFAMHGPDGETSAMPGVYLEVSEPNRIVFTNAFSAGWQPETPFMVGIFDFTDDGAGGTHYRAAARHWDEKTMRDHEAMGFNDGWGIVAVQIAEVAERLARE
jgi:uncharacterized protein YndB with AHSA1/START domain